jgi:hypothetical protein
MRQVYLPANAAEAHMLAHLLGEAGILAHVHGEALQGAIGELPAGNVIQLMVSDEDFDRARQLLLQWERVHAPPEPEAPRVGRRFRFVAAAVFLLVGLVSGWALKVALDNSRFSVAETTVGLDQNGDGRDDITWFYRLGSQTPHKSEGDANFDGAVDIVSHYDEVGTPVSEEADMNFDGVFETRRTFRSGVLARAEVDTDRNQIPDLTQTFEHGALAREELVDHRYGTVVRINTYALNRLQRAEIDLDRDGFRETARSFDRYGEVTSSETVQPN